MTQDSNNAPDYAEHSGALIEAAHGLWYDATNAVCQTMQDAGMCKCEDGQCIAATVDPASQDIEAFRAAIAKAEGRQS